MQQKNLSILKEHFVFESFELNSQHRFVEAVLLDFQKRKLDSKEYKFINAFYEKDSDHLINFEISSKDDFKNDWFEFYLKQLPGLAISDVKYMFTLSNSLVQMLPASFEMPADYPSEFCKEFLKDTYGNIVYTWQFMELLGYCLQGDENSHKHVDEYRRWYNMRLAKVFPIIEQLYLPDGYSLDKLLRKYTRLRSADSDYGFVIRPVVDYVWDFIQRAKKYV